MLKMIKKQIGDISIMTNKFTSMWNVNELEQKVVQLDIKGWLNHELLTWSWWLLIILLLIPWMIWIKLVDRTKLIELVIIGLSTSFITSLLDIVGTELDFWVYPTQLIPTFPRAFAFDVAMVPVAFMLLYQYFKTWKPYISALIILASIYAFIGEPFAHWAELVYYLKWKYIYSFLYYIMLGIGVRAFVEKLKAFSYSRH